MNIMSIIMAIFGATAQGLTWAVLALGVYISFRILDFADLTCEGSFTLGGSISAVLVVVLGWDPFLSLIIATLAGMAAGGVTGLLHTKLKIPAILSGILTMIGVYSINLRIMGQANIAILNKRTVISTIKGLFPKAGELGIREATLQTWVTILVGITLTIAVIVLLYWLFGTEIGCCIRATGNNSAMVRAQGVSTDRVTILGLIISNGLIALSGALVTQSQGYADINMGVGAIIIGLASIIIGEVIFMKARNFAMKLIAIMVGTVVYRIIIAVVLQLGLDTDYMRLLTSIVVAAALSIPVLTKNKMVRQKGGKA